MKKKIAVFCAIANPNLFIELLEKNGYEVVEKLFLIDHAFFSIKDLKDFEKRAKKKGAQAFVCSEKDMVKVKDLKLDFSIFYAEMDLKIVFGKDNFGKLISFIKK